MTRRSGALNRFAVALFLITALAAQAEALLGPRELTSNRDRKLVAEIATINLTTVGFKRVADHQNSSCSVRICRLGVGNAAKIEALRQKLALG